MIGVIGDHDPANRTHATLDESLAAAGAEWEWVATDEVPPADELERRFGGLWIAPASPYRSRNSAPPTIVTVSTTASEVGSCSARHPSVLLPLNIGSRAVAAGRAAAGAGSAGPRT